MMISYLSKVEEVYRGLLASGKQEVSVKEVGLAVFGDDPKSSQRVYSCLYDNYRKGKTRLFSKNGFITEGEKPASDGRGVYDRSKGKKVKKEAPIVKEATGFDPIKQRLLALERAIQFRMSTDPQSVVEAFAQIDNMLIHFLTR